jgi:hypothetical protein
VIPDSPPLPDPSSPGHVFDVYRSHCRLENCYLLLAGTRVALGAGVGLLIGDRLGRDARKGAGWPLLAVGALTTFPLMVGVLGKPQQAQVRKAP